MEISIPEAAERGGVSNAGRPPTVSDAELLGVFREAEDPVLIASEVAEAVDIGRRGVYKRLEQLAEDGELGQKKIGGRGTVWWLRERVQ